jgi:hypothetical protein
MWSSGGGWRGRCNSGELRRRGRPGTGVGWSRGSQGSISTRGWGSGGVGDGRRQHTQAAAAVACRPASGGAGWGDGLLIELLGILEGASVGSVDRGGGNRQLSRSGSHAGPWRTRGTATRQWRVHKEEERP